jgi:hypothetical protein
MKVEELKNHGKAYSETMAENSQALKKLFNKVIAVISVGKRSSDRSGLRNSLQWIRSWY